MSETKLKLVAGTDMGLARQNNEDNFAVCANLDTSEWIIPQVDDYVDLGEYGSLLMVADGMGGANAGEVASAIAVKTIQETFVPEKLSEIVGDDQKIQIFMKEAVKAADINILNHSKQDVATKGMGTTIVMAWLLGHRAFICWCGDSRCYALRKRGHLIRLTKDHSYVQGLIDRGELHPDMAIDHPLSNIITRCLGNSENRAEPETTVYELHCNDVLLLCTDGLCGYCTDSQIEELMEAHKDDIVACKNELISAALNAGGDDNITVSICSVRIEGEEIEEGENKEGQGKDVVEEATEDISPTVRSFPKDKKRKINSVYVLLSIAFAVLVVATIIWYYWKK